MVFDLHRRPELAIVPVVPVCPMIVRHGESVRRRIDLRFCFLLFPAKAKVGSLAVGLCLRMGRGFLPVSIAGLFGARFSPAPDSTYLRTFDSCLIGPAIALADFVVVAGFDFGLCRNCFAIATAAGPDSGRPRFVADLFSVAAVVAAAVVFVSGVASIVQSSFSLPPSSLWPLRSSDSISKWIHNATPHQSGPSAYSHSSDPCRRGLQASGQD